MEPRVGEPEEEKNHSEPRERGRTEVEEEGREGRPRPEACRDQQVLGAPERARHGPGRDPGHEQKEERLGRKASPIGEPDQERRPDHGHRVVGHEGREDRDPDEKRPEDGGREREPVESREELVREPAPGQPRADHEEGRERGEDVPVDRCHGLFRRNPARRDHDEGTGQGDGPGGDCPAADPSDGQQGGGHDQDGERRDERHNGQIATAIIVIV